MSKVAGILANKIGLKETQVDQVLDGLRFYVAEQLSKGEEVTLQGFVTFKFNDVPERQRKNPRTGEKLMKEAARFPKVAFKPSFKSLVTLGQPQASQPQTSQSQASETAEFIPYPAPDPSNAIPTPTPDVVAPVPDVIADAVPAPTIGEPPVIFADPPKRGRKRKTVDVQASEVPLPELPAFPPLPPSPSTLSLPPLPEKEYFLADRTACPESKAKTLPPDTLLYHPDFGQNWKKVSEVFH